MKNIFKSILAVILGIIVGAVLSILTDTILESLGIFPPATSPQAYTSLMLFVALVYRGIYTVLSGSVTAKVAPTNPTRHALILGIIGTVVTILSSIANFDKTSSSTIWYPIALILITLPCTLYGASKMGK